MNDKIKPLDISHLHRYAEIYANAFSGEPWNDPWKIDDAKIHVRELMEQKTSYGLEYEVDGEAVGCHRRGDHPEVALPARRPLRLLLGVADRKSVV